MRTIELSTAFKKDYKRVKANPRHAHDVQTLFEGIALLLAQDQPLPEDCKDHVLIGDWKGYRECHLKPDLLLIYLDILPFLKKGDSRTAYAARAGSCFSADA